MDADPMLMAIQHRPLEQSIARFKRRTNVTQLVHQLHILELTTLALSGAEVLVLSETSEGYPRPLSLSVNDGRTFAVAVTSLGHAVHPGSWSRLSGGAIDEDEFCYVPLSAQALLLNQFAARSNGVLLNQSSSVMDHAGMIDFGPVNHNVLSQFAELTQRRALLPEELLSLLAFEDERDQCQQIAHEYLLNPGADLSSVLLFKLLDVSANGTRHGAVGEGSPSRTARMYTTNAASALWAMRFGMEIITPEDEHGEIDFAVAAVPLLEAISELSQTSGAESGIILDEKVWINRGFAKSITEVHAG